MIDLSASDFPNHVLPRPVFGAHGAVEPLHAQCHADTLDHQRQEFLIVLVESPGDEHFERDIPARHRLGCLPQDRQDGVRHLAAARPIGRRAERFGLDRLDLMGRVELRNEVQFLD